MSIFSCKDTIGLASESLDHKLPFWRGLALRVHLLNCSDCRPFFRTLLFLDEAIRRLEDHGAERHWEAVGLSVQARERLQRVLEQHPG